MQNKKQYLRPGSLGKLYEFLEDNLPNHRARDRHLSVAKLAASIGVSKQYIYKWFENERVPAKYGSKLIEISGGSITLEKLAPFILK